MVISKEANYMILVINDVLYFKERTNDHVLKLELVNFTGDEDESKYQEIKRHITESFFPLFSGFHLFKSKLIRPTAIVFVDEYPSYFEYEGMFHFFANLGFRHIQFKARKKTDNKKPEEELRSYIGNDTLFEEVRIKN